MIVIWASQYEQQALTPERRVLGFVFGAGKSVVVYAQRETDGTWWDGDVYSAGVKSVPAIERAPGYYELVVWGEAPIVAYARPADGSEAGKVVVSKSSAAIAQQLDDLTAVTLLQ